LVHKNDRVQFVLLRNNIR